jgi:ABC-type sugar transport system substrate-binding protein
MKATQRIIAAALAFAAALSASAARNAKNSGVKLREIIVGAGSASNPYWYLDENNELIRL